MYKYLHRKAKQLVDNTTEIYEFRAYESRGSLPFFERIAYDYDYWNYRFQYFQLGVVCALLRRKERLKARAGAFKTLTGKPLPKIKL